MKEEIEININLELSKYFKILEKLLDETELITISQDTSKKKSLVFWKNNRVIDLPVTPGIYFVYRKQEQLPFYCGEAGNLKKRLQYHFSDSDSAIQYSTLKKYFDDINERTLRVMSDMLSIKIIEVPFCRWDAEEFFHKKYSINTKRNRKKKHPKN